MENSESTQELQAKIESLKAQIKATKEQMKSTPKPPELRIEFETGFVQIRRLVSGPAINLPAWAVAWMFEHAKELVDFMTKHKELLAAKDDTPEAAITRLHLREVSLRAGDSVVRPKRGMKETEAA